MPDTQIYADKHFKITLTRSRISNSLVVEAAGGKTVTIRAGAPVVIDDGQGNTLKLEPSGVTIQVAASVKIQASMVQVDAGSVVVTAGLTKFTGVVQCDTLQANNVIAASYTPGAGNIW